MAGIIKDFANNLVVAPGQDVPKEIKNILDRDHNGYFNDVYYYNGVNANYPATDRQSLRAKLYTQTITAASATVSVKEGTIVLSPTGAQTITLADPASPADDGKVLRFIRTTTQNVTINGKFVSAGTNTTSAADTTGHAGDFLWLQASAGRWSVINNQTFVLS